MILQSFKRVQMGRRSIGQRHDIDLPDRRSVLYVYRVSNNDQNRPDYPGDAENCKYAFFRFKNNAIKRHGIGGYPLKICLGRESIFSKNVQSWGL